MSLKQSYEADTKCFKNKPSFLASCKDWMLKSCTGMYHSMTLEVGLQVLLSMIHLESHRDLPLNQLMKPFQCI